MPSPAHVRRYNGRTSQEGEWDRQPNLAAEIGIDLNRWQELVEQDRVKYPSLYKEVAGS